MTQATPNCAQNSTPPANGLPCLGVPAVTEAREGPNEPYWLASHALAALREGWNVYDSNGSANGDWQVQCLDDPALASKELGFSVPILKYDDKAWRLVYEGTEPHHVAARTFLQAHNPKEWASIKKVGDALYGCGQLGNETPKN